MKAIISIRPKYAEQILNGTKQFEYRKTSIKCPVSSVLLYATYPIHKVIGEFTFSHIISATPEELWQQTQHAAGLTKDDFDHYFSRRKVAHALAITSVTRYPQPLDLEKHYGIYYAPQSFMYYQEPQEDKTLKTPKQMKNTTENTTPRKQTADELTQLFADLTAAKIKFNRYIAPDERAHLTEEESTQLAMQLININYIRGQIEELVRTIKQNNN